MRNISDIRQTCRRKQPYIYPPGTVPVEGREGSTVWSYAVSARRYCRYLRFLHVSVVCFIIRLLCSKRVRLPLCLFPKNTYWTEDLQQMLYELWYGFFHFVSNVYVTVTAVHMLISHKVYVLFLAEKAVAIETLRYKQSSGMGRSCCAPASVGGLKADFAVTSW